MKSYRVVIFIFSVIALLGLLCAFFPADGVTIGSTRLSFASLESVLTGEEDNAVQTPDETPEQILARRLAELRAAEQAQFVDFCTNSQTRIFFPDDKVETFDSFFAALDSASLKPVRIAYYGDSQLEEDRITNNLREQLQRRFGGNGVGMVPLMMPYTTLTLKQRRTADVSRSIVYGSKDFSVPAGRYGPMGQASRLNGSLEISFAPNARMAEDHPSRFYSRVTVLTDTLRAPISLRSGSAEATLDTLALPMRRYRLALPDSTVQSTLKFSGTADVYGVMLDGEAGVSVDNIAMRGCSGTIFTKIDAGQLADYYSNENVGLIVLQYGGNTMPYIKHGKSLDQYSARIYEQILYIRRQAPDAAVLFIGPSDMSTSVAGKMQTYPVLEEVVDSLRSVANRAGAGYWDLYQVMGGKNAMVDWVRSGFAGKDYVHFTHKGADEVGNLLSKALMLYYDYYRWRTRPLGEMLTPEVVNSLMSSSSEE